MIEEPFEQQHLTHPTTGTTKVQTCRDDGGVIDHHEIAWRQQFRQLENVTMLGR
jgi:hypothetical protein